MRTAKELLIASKEFAKENRVVSWWHLLSTLALVIVLFAAAVSGLHWGIRSVASIVLGLVWVRLFIIYHDVQHNAMFKGSTTARFVMALFGLITASPPSVWRRSHDHHHKHNSKIFGAHIGSYPIMTTQAYANAGTRHKWVYAASRHPLLISLGYFTVFLWGMSLRPFLQNPARHFDGLVAGVLSLGSMATLGWFGLDMMLLGMTIPIMIAAAMGAYLFYAQHNFPTARLKPNSEWSHVDAALNASSYIAMSPLMHWFTGNIGYHHVHHLNAQIPFYRLPEAMASLEELQTPGITTLKFGDVLACLRLKLWSPEQNRFVTFAGE